MFRTLRPLQLAADIAIAAIFALVAVPFEATVTASLQSETIAAMGVALLMAAALAVRRWAPGLSLAVAWVGAIVQMFALLSPRGSDVVIFAVLYATAAYGTRLVYWLGFASSIGGAVVITWYVYAITSGLTLENLPTAIALLIAALFGLLLAWVSGALVRSAVRSRENRRAQQAAEAATAAEQVRVRIARDMHDVVAHSLAVVIAQADGARYAAASDPAAATSALGTISTTARAALADVRLLLTQLRHSEGEGPQPTLADTEALYAQVRAAGVELHVDVDPAPPGEPPATVQLAVYRILQEALTNALRHGDGGAVKVQLRWLHDRVELNVRNARTAEPGPGGHGLIGMRERAQLAGGRLEAGADGDDFLVAATLPLGGVA